MVTNKRLKNKIHTTVILSDIHWQIRHKKAVNNVTKFLKDYNPDKLVLAGDIWDAHFLSRFPKKKKEARRLVDLGDEIKSSVPTLNEWAEYCESANYFIGNHEARKDSAEDREPGLPHSVLSWENIFNHYGINKKIVIYKGKIVDDFFRVGKAKIRHGDKYSLHQAWLNISKWHQLNEGELVVQGHSHHPAVYFWNNRVSVVNGHLMDKKKQTYSFHPNWTMGFTVIEHYNNMKNFNCYFVSITEKGQFTFGGKVYD